MSLRTAAIVILIVTSTIIYLERAYFPKVVTVEKEVVREVAITTTHEVKTPDGTIITDTVTHETKQSTVTKSEPVQTQPDWVVSAGMDMSKNYSLQVQRRVLGPIVVGVQASTDQRISVSIGAMF